MVLELLQRGVPFAQWEAPAVLSWLEVWVAFPHWYVSAIKKVIRCGANLEVRGGGRGTRTSCPHPHTTNTISTPPHPNTISTPSHLNIPHFHTLPQNITEVELEQELGITNCLHRLKLRLAVQEIVNLTSSPHPQQARKVTAANHCCIS